jgi:hypothetical protein
MIVRRVSIGGNIDHNCVNILFIITNKMGRYLDSSVEIAVL